jgi:hypothetical protein
MSLGAMTVMMLVLIGLAELHGLRPLRQHRHGREQDIDTA